MSATPQVLRPYQNAASSAVMDTIIMGYKRVLYTMATGCGKTTVFAELVRLFREYHGYKVLVLAHRRELITQAYQRVKDHCGLDEWQIGIELAETFASKSSEVIVGSVQTVVGAHRLPEWIPDVIIYDEAHRAAASTYRKIMDRMKERNEDLLVIGCTATAKRTDRQSLYALKPDGSAVELFDKKRKIRYPASPEECVFETLCYEFSILDAVEEGWLVPIKGHTVETETDLSEVETDRDGDFKEGQLQKAVDNNARTLLAINAWKQIAVDRPTIVFCAGVEHAHHAADLWRQAGYTAAALDGETDSTERYQTLEAFRQGRLQVLCNMGLFTEGTDLPSCACVVHLRPTKSWNLYVQMTGRGSRTLPGVVDGIEDAQERRAAIEQSGKPDCLVIDLVDICESNDLCSVPSILDLPAGLDLQGQSVTEAKRLLDEFEEVRDRVIGECPTTYRELQVRLAQVDMLRHSNAKTQTDWAITPEGFRFRRCPPGYKADIKPTDDGGYELTVGTPSDVLFQKKGKPGNGFKAYLDHAARYIGHTITNHQGSISRGTLAKLSPKQIGCLKANGHTPQEIDCMTYYAAKALIGNYMQAWQARQQEAQEAGA